MIQPRPRWRMPYALRIAYQLALCVGFGILIVKLAIMIGRSLQ